MFGYALLGATWLVMKTEDVTQDWARKSAGYVFVVCGTVYRDCQYFHAGDVCTDSGSCGFRCPISFSWRLFPHLPWCCLSSYGKICTRGMKPRPFLMSMGVFLTAYFGLGISLWPWLVPFDITFRQAAAAPESPVTVACGDPSDAAGGLRVCGVLLLPVPGESRP